MSEKLCSERYDTSNIECHFGSGPPCRTCITDVIDDVQDMVLSQENKPKNAQKSTF